MDLPALLLLAAFGTHARAEGEAPAVPSPPDPPSPPALPPPSDPPSPPAVPPARPPVTATFGKGVTIGSADGRFSLQIRGRIQGQFAALTHPEEPTDVGFAVRRLRLTFRGNLFSHDIEYFVQLGMAPRDMEPDLLIPLRDAFLAWRGLRDLNITFGQKKVPFNRERVTSSAALQLVDRSISNAEFTLDRDIGLQLSSDDLGGLGGRLGYQIGVFAGDGRHRVNEGPGLLYVARLQVQPLGEFEDLLPQADLTRSPRARLSLGAGVAFNHQARRERSTNGEFYEATSFDQLHAEGDLTLKCAGFSLSGEVLYRRAMDGTVHTEVVDGLSVTERARDGMGGLAQAGWLVPRVPLELAARWSQVFPLGEETGLVGRREITAGMSVYILNQDLKVQADYGWLTFDDAAPQHQVRVQAQVAF